MTFFEPHGERSLIVPLFFRDVSSNDDDVHDGVFVGLTDPLQPRPSGFLARKTPGKTGKTRCS